MISAPTYVILHDNDLEMVQGDQCAAMLLSVLRFWNNHHEWVEATQEEMRVALKGIFSRNRVIAALKMLRENGFVEARSNPDNRQTRTLQYQVVETAQVKPAEDTELPTWNAESSAQDIESSGWGVSTLEKESDSGIDKESSPREGDEPTQGDKDDDDCPAHIRQEIEQIKTQIGAGRVNAVLDRCNGKARTWHYILKALRNERSQRKPSPSSAAPLRNYAYVPPVDLAWERHLAAGGGA
jgi:hypothetical protein